MSNIKSDKWHEFKDIGELLDIIERSVKPTDLHVINELVSIYHNMAEDYHGRWERILSELHKERAKSNAKG